MKMKMEEEIRLPFEYLKRNENNRDTPNYISHHRCRGKVFLPKYTENCNKICLMMILSNGRYTTKLLLRKFSVAELREAIRHFIKDKTGLLTTICKSLTKL